MSNAVVSRYLSFITALYSNGFLQHVCECAGVCVRAFLHMSQDMSSLSHINSARWQTFGKHDVW